MSEKTPHLNNLTRRDLERFIIANILQLGVIITILIEDLSSFGCTDFCNGHSFFLSLLFFAILLLDLALSVKFLSKYSLLPKWLNVVLIIIFVVFSLRDRFLISIISGDSSIPFVEDVQLLFDVQLAQTAFIGSLFFGILILIQVARDKHWEYIIIGVFNIILPFYVVIRWFVLYDFRQADLIAASDDSPYYIFAVKLLLMPIFTIYATNSAISKMTVL